MRENFIDYPVLFRIPTPPKRIYYEGNIELLLSSKRVAIVWPRKLSNYAIKVLDSFFSYAKNYIDLCIISWGAQWVDEYAHMRAIENNLTTIMILWWWIQYYKESAKWWLVQKVLQSGGLLLSEYEWNVLPTQYTYPQRNRIIAGISHGVFLPEAWEKSGALLTVWYANKAKIPVYAPMQDIFNVYSLGSNKAIVDGRIKPVHIIWDVLVDLFWPLEWLFQNENQEKSLLPDEKTNTLSVQDSLIKQMEIELE